MKKLLSIITLLIIVWAIRYDYYLAGTVSAHVIALIGLSIGQLFLIIKGAGSNGKRII